MNTHFHAPSFGDEIIDLEANDTATLTTNCFNSSMSTGNVVSNNNANYIYQTQPQQTKRMINLHNTSDEYHTANEDSFNATKNTVTLGNSSLSPQASGQQQAAVATPPPTLAARKQMSPTDTNEPAKPLSAYALFFRDTVSAIKQQNPVCSFQELSKIVASMWDALDPVHKSVYNKKNELAKNEYIKQMRAYRLQQEQQQQQQQTAQAAADIQQSNVVSSTLTASKPAVFTMNINQQQGQGQTVSSPSQQQQQQQASNINQQNAASNVTTSAPSGDQAQMLSEAGAVQKCTRDDCPKRAIINPDWEDEYCSNECVVIHCRNVFNDWVKSNLEAKQQQQKPEMQQQKPELPQQQQQPQATT